MAAGDSVQAFYAARGFLFAHRDDYDTAYRDFRWPELDTFNWALDHVDAVAADPVRGARRALWIVEQDGTEAHWTFAELAARSNRVANRLREWGVRRGDRIVLMLGNQVELWETLLAAMKLGAVVIPATTQLRAADVRDRLDRGGARHVVVAASATGAFADVRRRLHPHRGRRRARRVAGLRRRPTRPRPTSPRTAVTRADDPLLLYFTSGTTARPKLVEHTHASLPGRAPVDDVLDRAGARRRPPQHLLAGLGEARLEQRVRPVVRRGAACCVLQLRTVRRPGRAGRPRPVRRHDASAPRRRCGGC